MLEEIKKEFDCLPIKKNLYDTDEGQTFIAELIAVDKRNLWPFIEQKLTEAITQAKIEENEYWKRKIFHPDSIMPGISIMDFAIRINELKETHN